MMYEVRKKVKPGDFVRFRGLDGAYSLGRVEELQDDGRLVYVGPHTRCDRLPGDGLTASDLPRHMSPRSAGLLESRHVYKVVVAASTVREWQR